MDLIELGVLALGVVLFFVIIANLFRLRIPRRVSLKGIEDPEASEAYDRISRMPQFRLITCTRNGIKPVETY